MMLCIRVIRKQQPKFPKEILNMRNSINFRLDDDTSHTCNIRHLYSTNNTLTRPCRLLKVVMIACVTSMVMLCCNACRQTPFQVPHHPEDPAVRPFQVPNRPGEITLGAQYSQSSISEETDSDKHSSGFYQSACTFNGIPLYGRVEIVNAGADLRVEIVNAGADLKVTKVNYPSSSCGDWQIVNAGADFRVEIVNAGADLKIEW